MLGSGWAGTASDAATASLRTQATTADELVEILSLVRRVTLALADAVVEAQALLAEADRVAAAHGLRVHDPGTIVHGAELTEEGQHAAVHRRVEDLVVRALALAREADDDAARGLRAALNAGSLDDQDEQALVDEVLAPDLPYRPSPEVAAAWWASLSLAAQEALLRLHPDSLGNLEGIPYDVRVRANRINVAHAVTELSATERELTRQMADVQARIDELMSDFDRADATTLVQLRQELDVLARELTDTQELRQFCSDLLHERTMGYDADGHPVDLTGHQVVLFDLEGGRFAEIVGSIGPNTEDIGVFVGGTGSNLAGMGGSYDRAYRFVVDPAVQPPGTLAVISYLGGPMPQEVLFDAVDTSYALNQADDLADFVNHIDNPTGAPVTVVGHSYGGSVVGAAEAAGMHADRILHVESAGAGPGIGSSGDYAFPDTDRYSMTAPGDPIQLAQGSSVGPLGHGIDPDAIDGVVRLETGLVDAEDPSSGILEGGAAHSGVFNPGTTAFENILGVMTGGDVSLYGPPTIQDDGLGWLGILETHYPMEDPSYQPPIMDVR